MPSENPQKYHIPSKITNEVPIILSHGYKLMDGDRELNLDDFKYNLELVNEFHFRFHLEKEGGWKNPLKFTLPINNDFLHIDIKPKRKKCKLFVKSPESLYEAGFGNQKIPRIIHQTFIQHQVTEKMYQTTLLTRQLNPEYTYMFYDNHESREFIRENFNQDVLHAYDHILPGAFKADLWRYCVLYVLGGVYYDIPMEPLVPIRNIISYQDEFVVPRDTPSNRFYLYNAFMACIPKHPALLIAINMIISNVKTKWYGSISDSLTITGPGLLGKAVNKLLNKYENNDFTLGISGNDKYKIHILEHLPGFLYKGNIKIFNTKYEGYHQDRDCLAGPHYSSLYRDNAVYCESIVNRLSLSILQDQLIPNIIYQTFCTGCVSKNIYKATQSWKDINPNYNYHFYTTDSQLSFITEHFGERVSNAYSKIIPDHYKTELWKYCCLYTFGGIYCDLYTICKYPISSIIDNNTGFITVVNNKTNEIDTCFISSIAKNPFLLKIILTLVQNIENNNYGNSEREITGGYILQKLLSKYLKKGVFPGNYNINNINTTLLAYNQMTKWITSANNAVIYSNLENFNYEKKVFGCNNFTHSWEKKNIYRDEIN